MSRGRIVALSVGCGTALFHMPLRVAILAADVNIRCAQCQRAKWGTAELIDCYVKSEALDGKNYAASTHRLSDTYGKSLFCLVIAQPDLERQFDLLLAAFRTCWRNGSFPVFCRFVGNGLSGS